MRIFADRRKKAAIIVDDPSAICMPIDVGRTTDYGVCMSVTGRYGTTDPTTNYLDTVLLLASRTPTGLRETAQG